MYKRIFIEMVEREEVELTFGGIEQAEEEKIKFFLAEKEALEYLKNNKFEFDDKLGLKNILIELQKVGKILNYKIFPLIPEEVKTIEWSEVGFGNTDKLICIDGKEIIKVNKEIFEFLKSEYKMEKKWIKSEF